MKQGESPDFRVIADAMPIPVVISRFADGRLLYCNTLMTEMFGLSREDILVRHATDFYADPAQRKKLIAHLETSASPVQFEMEAPPAPGRPRWVSLTARRIAFDGEPAILVSMVDISERKRGEEALRSSEELYRVLFESSPFPSWATDIETWEFLAVNDAAVSHYGYTREEFITKMTPRDLRPPEDGPILAQQMERSRREDRPLVHPARHRRKDGSMIQVELTVSPLVFKERPAWIVTVNDVTERMRLEDELERARKLESLGRLAGGVAHDFNNFLTAILGYTQLLEKRFASDPEALVDLGEVRAAGSQARDLTQQLLAVARRQASVPRVIDLNALLSEMQRLLCRLVGEGVELLLRLSPQNWPIKVDRSQVEQVLINLALNARDAMGGKGTLVIRTETRILGAEEARGHVGLVPGEFVTLEVEDTGVGMAPEVLAHVFEPFFTTKPSGEGTGLGLATVYGIVTQSGGWIWVKSAVGEGTTFTLCFPRSKDPVRIAEAELPAEVRGGRETILVVEDNAAVRALTVRVLRSAGYEVRAAATGPAALKLAERDSAPIDLLVTDVVMPGMSGRVVAERLGQTRPVLKVLYVSGYSQDSMNQHGALGPAERFLAKPFTGPVLLQHVRDLLDRAGAGGPS